VATFVCTSCGNRLDVRFMSEHTLHSAGTLNPQIALERLAKRTDDILCEDCASFLEDVAEVHERRSFHVERVTADGRPIEQALLDRLSQLY
jgi:hypothetical protein